MQATMPTMRATETDTSTAMMTTPLPAPLLLDSSVLADCPLLPVGCAQHALHRKNMLRSSNSNASLRPLQVV